MNTGTIILIVCILVFIVIPSLRDKTIPIKKLVIGPAIFLWMFWNSLGKDIPLFWMSHMIAVTGGLLGAVLGYFLRLPTKVRADKIHKTIFLKGSLFSLSIFLVIFAVHFLIGYLKATQTQMFVIPSWQNQGLLMLLALVSCFPLGGNICLYLKYRSA